MSKLESELLELEECLMRNDDVADNCAYVTLVGIANEVADLEAENAKLRELVDELYPLAYYGAMRASELDMAHNIMRELGMVVE